MEQESDLTFIGPGPFTLPVVQSIKVLPSNGAETISISARILLPETGELATVYVPMVTKIASGLLDELHQVSKTSAWQAALE